MRSDTSAGRVLLVEDDGALGGAVVALLAGAGHTVRWAKTCAEARQVLSEMDCELVVLDLGLPDGDGLDLCIEMRDRGDQTAVVVLTARSDESEAIRVLDGGADDFVAKPFRAGELVARLGAHLRRTPTTDSDITVGPIRVNPGTRTAWLGEESLILRRREFDLLAVLANNAGSVTRRDVLMAEVWGEEWAESTRTLDVHIAALRRKLADAGDRWERIETVRGYGYLLHSD